MFEFEKIEKVRKKLGYKSREEFSKSLDIPFATLRSYETAKVENIPHSFFQLLHDKFNVNINYFFDEKEEIFKNNVSSMMTQRSKASNTNKPKDEAPTPLTKYFIALEAVAKATGKELELAGDIQGLMKKYLG